MEKTFNITLKDVARFLKSLSYDWNGEIINYNNLSQRTTFDYISSANNWPISINLKKDNNLYRKHVAIDEITFNFCSENPNYCDIASDYIIDENLSSKWILFLAQKYGKEYCEYVNEACDMRLRTLFDSVKQQLIFNKNEISQQTRHHLKYYKSIKTIVSNTDVGLIQ